MEIGPLNRVSSSPLIYASPVLKEEPAKTQEIVMAVRALNRSEFAGKDRHWTFQSDPKTHQVVVRIVDRTSGDVIDQIPNDQVLRLAAELKRQEHKENA
jgi:uncharacterized FlaG/YvyC family protein